MARKTLREPTSPGEILQKEFLEPLGISQTALARHVGWTQPKVNEIVTGKRGITPQTAMVLADAFATTPLFWLNLQIAQDLWRAGQKHKKVRSLVGHKCAS